MSPLPVERCRAAAIGSDAGPSDAGPSDADPSDADPSESGPSEGDVGIDPVAIVWADADGRPTRLVWAGSRWRVTDRPTVITEPVSWWRRLDVDAQLTSVAPRTCTGWRFQATADDGRSCVLDVRDEGDPARWFVVKVYE